MTPTLHCCSDVGRAVYSVITECVCPPFPQDHLHEFILEQPEYREGNMEEAILKGFLQVGKNANSNSETVKAAKLAGRLRNITHIQGGWGRWPTGNGKKLSNS